MTTTLNAMSNSTRETRTRKRVGRGKGSKLGKTCGRGNKGAGSRCGYKRRLGNEGGVIPLYRKLPGRGFTRGRWQKPEDTVNLEDIERIFEAGATVTAESLREHGFLSGPVVRLKVLGSGEITKKVTIHADAFSESAKAKLDAVGATYRVLEKGDK